MLEFRGSKFFLNYIVDDFDAFTISPYSEKDCPGSCEVHKGFYDAWELLKPDLLKFYKELGCGKRSLRVSGHSMGAAMAALAAFEMAGNGTALAEVYTMGQTRVGNKAWVEEFEKRMAGVGISFIKVGGG